MNIMNATKLTRPNFREKGESETEQSSHPKTLAKRKMLKRNRKNN
jgi:hypothetical protein